MQAEDIDELCNPGQEYTLIDPSPLLHSVCHFVNNLAASWKHYDMMQTIEHLHRPNDVILSFDQVKRCVQWLSGVVPIEHDMCMNSCLAFTGPCETLDACPRCLEPQYCLGTSRPQKCFTTIPWGLLSRQCTVLVMSQILCIIWKESSWITWIGRGLVVVC